MTQPLPDPIALLGLLENARAQVVIVSTGGGSPAIPHLLTTPGASGVVLECLVPYARQAVDRLLGAPQEAYCSSRAARRLAVMAWQRACGLGASPSAAIGMAVTASLRSRAPKRGEHRVVVALHGLGATTVATLVLQKGARSRADEEMVAAALLLDRLAAFPSLNVTGPNSPAVSLHPTFRAGMGLRDDEHVAVECCEPPPEWRELLVGTRTAFHACKDSSRSRPTSVAESAGTPATDLLVFPGSFDPLHEGHVRMAVIAQEIAERPIDFEISVTNVDKPSLDYLEMTARAAQFTDRSAWFTRAATFVEKLDIFPRGTFVMGADTYARLADPKYYGGSAEAADRAVRRIAAQAGGLIVFGRERDGVFDDPAKLDVPTSLRHVTYFVSQREFRMDISSTAIRRRTSAVD